VLLLDFPQAGKHDFSMQITCIHPMPARLPIASGAPGGSLMRGGMAVIGIAGMPIDIFHPSSARA
jgi:hypothetical protein